ncbi:MAG: hypothetical protein KC635_30065 [Myxococcales bacterium]|nr:hypothetical protein [Myxococcales bacterium]MCB9732856.1 cytochrome-c peroxidase [Deltaproteobacteria bacterium]
MSWPAEVVAADNPTTAAKAELGRLLFYDPVLSSDGETACATCHSEIWGMGDGLAKAVGVGGGLLTGPGRDGPAVGRRNAQSLWNVAYRTTLFRDGRASTLEEQALMPMHDERELAKAPDDVVADLRASDGYVARFAAAFPGEAEPVTVTTLTRALAAFQRTLTSRGASYDAYVAGDVGALSEAAVEGMWRFAEAGCDSCHAPPLFGSDGFYARGAGATPGEDGGRGEITGEAGDWGAFRVPSLRNARDTGPYFHDGSVEDLEDAVRHELARDAPGGEVDEADVSAITTFLEKGLTDQSRAPARPDEVPSGLAVPKDGFRIPR